ncbi:hypothetical protein VNI00_018833 [Paramarasmius palmivorus]|uniref:F-box domain-containing protein n=1 Tax=Paramarasmius palmivorus TaxID=297713 RepID=A0AAW0ATG8_9AGAR
MDPEIVNLVIEPAVHRLPTESLLSIFKLASPPDGVNIYPQAIRNEAPWKIGRVCRLAHWQNHSRWRNIVKNTPELWTILVLDREKLPHSAQAPFWQNFSEIIDVLSERSSGRRQLEFRLADTTNYNHSDVVGRRISQSFLTCLFNRQVDIQPIIPWGRITAFHLSKYRLEDYLHEVLRKCENLQELVLDERDFSRWDSTEGWELDVKLARLRMLKLVVRDPTEHSRVLRILTLPSLERLEMIILKDPEYYGPSNVVFAADYILEMLGRSGCTLKALCVQNLRYQHYGLCQLLKNVPRLEELSLEGDISGCVVEKFVAKLVGLKKLVIRCTPCTKSGAGLPPPIDDILGAVRSMPMLRSLEVQARIPRHMWRTGDQMEELRSSGIQVLEDYREPAGKDTMMLWCREMECAVIDNAVTLLCDRSVFPADVFKEIPNPEKDPGYTRLERLWNDTLALPVGTRDKIRQLIEEWPRGSSLQFRIGNDGLTFSSFYADYWMPIPSSTVIAQQRRIRLDFDSESDED